MLSIRRAGITDLDFLVRVDRDDEGYTIPSPKEWTEAEIAQHRDKFAGFVTDPNEGAWVYEDTTTGRLVGAILCRFRDRRHEADTGANAFLFRYIPDDWVPADGRFCEVFNLWIDPAYRRQGLATNLKRCIEIETLRRGISLIYTHTEERNEHVLALNQKLGYREIRRGPIWDEVVRVSLIKSPGREAAQAEEPV
jgi:ribosomal protein S18 acetylase RimI-like enzyme